MQQKREKNIDIYSVTAMTQTTAMSEEVGLWVVCGKLMTLWSVRFVSHDRAPIFYGSCSQAALFQNGFITMRANRRGHTRVQHI